MERAADASEMRCNAGRQPSIRASALVDETVVYEMGKKCKQRLENRREDEPRGRKEDTRLIRKNMCHLIKTHLKTGYRCYYNVLFLGRNNSGCCFGTKTTRIADSGYYLYL